MNRQILVFVALGSAVVAVLVGVVLLATKGAHLELKGSVQKIRLLKLEESATLVMMDFRFVNAADYPFIVRKVDVTLTDAQGNKHPGMVIADPDMKRVFDYYPLLGPKYNPSLIVRTKIAPKESMDRMLGIRFELPESAVAARQELRIRVEEVDGPVSEIVETPGAASAQ